MSVRTNVKVCVRFRPFNKRELALGESKSRFKVTHCNNESTLECTGPSLQNHNFTFDRLFEMGSNQQEVYTYVGKPCIDDVMQGFNATIFAYGQTGAGKSFSMMGDLHQNEIKGIIPRGANQIFGSIAADTSSTEYSVKCSYLEIYNEEVRDLLDATGTKKNLKIHEAPNRGVYVANLTEEYAYNEEEIYTLIDIGQQNRAVASTQMNSESSRSHSCFIIEVLQKNPDGSTKNGRLNLVDLAGSEKVGKTGATGQTLEEAKGINKSLSALGLCINALVEGRKHIPYRDSKLTRILQDSLGGNTKTTLLCACSPHDDNYDETVSTLKFGARAKTIKTSVKANTVKSAAELMRIIEELKAEIASLKVYISELEKNVPQGKIEEIRNNASQKANAEGDGDGAGTDAADDGVEVAEKSYANEELQAKVRNLESDLADAATREEELNRKVAALEAEREQAVRNSENTVRQVEQERADWTKERALAEKEREALEQDVETVISELEDTKSQRDKALKDLATIRTQFNEYKLQNGDMQKLAAEQEILFEELALAEEKLLVANERAETLRQAADTAKARQKDVEKERDELYEYIAQLEGRTDGGQPSGNVRNSLPASMPSSSGSGTGSGSHAGGSGAQWEAVLAEKRATEARLDEATARNQQLSSERTELQMQVKRLQEKLAEQEQKRRAEEEAAQQGEAEVRDANKRAGQLEYKNKSLQSRCDALEEELRKTRETLRAASEEKAEAERAKTDAESKLKEQDEKLVTLQKLNENNARRPRIWKPIMKDESVLNKAFATKEEFGIHKLRQTGSSLLEKARMEASVADSPKAGSGTPGQKLPTSP